MAIEASIGCLSAKSCPVLQNLFLDDQSHHIVFPPLPLLNTHSRLFHWPSAARVQISDSEAFPKKIRYAFSWRTSVTLINYTLVSGNPVRAHTGEFTMATGDRLWAVVVSQWISKIYIYPQSAHLSCSRGYLCDWCILPDDRTRVRSKRRPRLLCQCQRRRRRCIRHSGFLSSTLRPFTWSNDLIIVADLYCVSVNLVCAGRTAYLWAIIS